MHLLTMKYQCYCTFVPPLLFIEFHHKETRLNANRNPDPNPKPACTKMSGSGHPTDSLLKVKKVRIWWSRDQHFHYPVRHFEFSPRAWSTAE